MARARSVWRCTPLAELVCVSRKDHVVCVTCVASEVCVLAAQKKRRRWPAGLDGRAPSSLRTATHLLRSHTELEATLATPPAHQAPSLRAHMLDARLCSFFCSQMARAHHFRRSPHTHTHCASASGLRASSPALRCARWLARESSHTTLRGARCRQRGSRLECSRRQSPLFSDASWRKLRVTNVRLHVRQQQALTINSTRSSAHTSGGVVQTLCVYSPRRSKTAIPLQRIVALQCLETNSRLSRARRGSSPRTRA